MTTVAQIITDAMYDAGKLGEGATPSAAQYVTNMRKLNDIITLLSTQGIKLWLERDVSVALVAGTPTYTVTSGGLKLTRSSLAYWLDADGRRRPVGILSREEWTRLGDPTTSGSIVGVFPEKLLTSFLIHCYQIPDAEMATGTLHLVGQEAMTNFTATTDLLTIAFPQEWALALRWLLAADICTGQSQTIIQRCEQKAQMYRDLMDDWDVEDADTRFTPSGPAMEQRRFR